MRIFTLVKREVRDNLVYFILCAFFSLLIGSFMISFADRGFTGGSWRSEIGKSMEAEILASTMAGPFVMAAMANSFLIVMGIGRMYNRKSGDISGFLLILPTTRGHLFIVGIITGLLAIGLLLGPSLVFGAVWLPLYLPSFSPFYLVFWKILLTIFLMFLASYCFCLGMQLDRMTDKPLTISPRNSFIDGFFELLFVIFFLPLLVVIKGFGGSANGIFVLFIMACLIYAWCDLTGGRRVVKVLTAGFFVLVYFSIPLFFTRNYCEKQLIENLPESAKICGIEPLGIIPEEFEQDPNVVRPSSFTGRVKSAWAHLGIVDYALRGVLNTDRARLYHFEDDNNWWYFNKATGLIHYATIVRQKRERGSKEVRRQLFIGPDGMAETPDEALGRFSDPLIYSIPWRARPELIYDKAQRRFFLPGYAQKTVVKGPASDDGDNPVQIGSIAKGWSRMAHLSWRPPMVARPDETNSNTQSYQWVTYGINTLENWNFLTLENWNFLRYVPVLDASGRIDLLNTEDLTLTKAVGYLPGPAEFSSTGDALSPKDLLAYRVIPFQWSSEDYRKRWQNPNPEQSVLPDSTYLGMVVAALDRQGSDLVMTVYDAQGQRLKTKHNVISQTDGSGEVRTAEAIFFAEPWSPLLTIGKYISEILHPPILSLVSFFTASRFEAGSGHRALFILPNSFAAMMGRNTTQNIVVRFLECLLLLMPALLVSGLFSILTARDARRMGLPSGERRLWKHLTLFFGLPAYVTYRILRPRITLVTCPVCGKGRRPDQACCYQCDSPWENPDISPPSWRVLAS